MNRVGVRTALIGALAAVLVFAATGEVGGTSDSTSTSTSTTTSTLSTSTTAVTSTTTTSTTLRRSTTTTTINPGELPQTTTEPSLATQPGSALYVMMSELWNDILENRTGQADTMMFPEAAYEKLKAIPYPASDYVNRLQYLFNLDVSAYRSFLRTPGTPVLVRVETSPVDAQWIPVGACYNKIGYWHLPGVRFVYRYGGTIDSVGVLSMISWRGKWYFIHLGQYTATGSTGQIYDFAHGPGMPGPAGSC